MFDKKKKEMMVYVIMGFLEAGKTSLICDLLTDDMFDDQLKTLILACEEGEEEYEQEMLAKTGAVCEYIEDEGSFRGNVITKFLKSTVQTVLLLSIMVCGLPSIFRNYMMIWRKSVLTGKCFFRRLLWSMMRRFLSI